MYEFIKHVSSHILGILRYTELFECLKKQILIWQESLQTVIIRINVPYIADESTPSTIMLYPAYALQLNVHILNKIIRLFKQGCDIIKITGSS